MDYMNVLHKDGTILAIGWATFTAKEGESTGPTKVRSIPPNVYTDWEYDSVGKDIRLRATPAVSEELLVSQAKDVILTKLAREALGLPADKKNDDKLEELSTKVAK